MPLSVGVKGRPVVRRTRGRPKRAIENRTIEEVPSVADMSAIIPDEAALEAPPRTAKTTPKKRKVTKAKSIRIMEEMLKSVRESERQCRIMSTAVNEKLANLSVADTSRFSNGRRGLNTSRASRTTSTPNPASTIKSFNGSQFDDMWEDMPSLAHTSNRQQHTTKHRRQTGRAGHNNSRGRITTPRFPAIGHDGDAPNTSRRQSQVPDVTVTDTAAKTTLAAEEAVRIIAAAAQNKSAISQRKKGIPADYVFPYDLVERGDAGKKLKKGEATLEEYYLGLKRLEEHPSFPLSALKALSQHQTAIIQDSCKLPWAVIRRYSEDIFTRIGDGRIVNGWENTLAMEVIRLETIAISHYQTSEVGTQQSKPYSRDPKNVFDKNVVGTPCVIWNREPEKCEKASKGEAHGSGQQKFAHICGYCANVRHLVANHPEVKCYSKKARTKQTDKSAAQDF